MADPFRIRERPSRAFTLHAFRQVLNLSDLAMKVAGFGQFLNKEVSTHI